MLEMNLNDKVDKTKKIDVKEKNKIIKTNLMSRIKEKKNKKAAEQLDKNVRKITEFVKPKPEHPRIPANNIEYQPSGEGGAR